MVVFSFTKKRQIHWYLIVILVVVVLGFWCTLAAAHQCNHGHEHHHHHHLDSKQTPLPEEIAEEEDLKMMWADHVHDDSDTDLSGLSLWIHAMGCSLLVSLASLICLILLPVIFVQGKPSKTIVDSLAIFGAGAMLGDAFLHQLPHAFGGGHDHSHDHHEGHSEQSHSHSLKDLSIGLSVLAGIVIFLIVEKVVRYVEAFGGASSSGLGHHHHHHHKTSNKLKDDKDAHESHQELSNNEEKEQDIAIPSVNGSIIEPSKQIMQKRNTGRKASEGSEIHAEKISKGDKEFINDKEPITKSPSNLVFGYLNLFSDGVHNFTDGMALGSAFLLYGSVGGWSRTLFLLAHELPQEIGDFGILVRSGFSVSKALFFNFLSALVALAGTSLALMWGKDPGQSSLIEGFTAGGFIYISVAGVLAEMNNGSSPALRSTALQLISLVLGMAVALCISLVE